MAEHELELPGVTAFMEPENSEGVAENVRTDGSGDLRLVGYSLHHVLNGSHLVGESFVKGEVVLKDRSKAIGEGDYPNLGAFAIGAAFAFDPDSSLLPLDLLTAEAGELANPKAGLEQAPNAELLAGGLGGVEEPISFLD